MPRLLFVDDEPRVLQGLRQCLWSKRKTWEMTFVESGALALAELERQPFEAVISDMRMPVMDGAELLERVRIVQPNAFRVVLSGQMDEHAAVRAAAAAHRFLTKPCDPALLLTTLTYGLELQSRMNSEGMRACVGGAADLPSPPATAVALNRALENDGSSLQDVSRVIETDSAMAAMILKLVNSAFFGLGRRIVSIEHAVGQLGLRPLRSLVLAHALFQDLTGKSVKLLELEQSRFLLAAQFARRFRLPARESETALTGALLHNVGTLLLMVRAPEAFEASRTYAREHAITVADAERDVMGVTHAEVGAYLLALWGLPEEVIEVVGVHHRPLADLPVLDAGAVVCLAEALASERFDTSSTDAQSLDEPTLLRLGVLDTVRAIRAGND